MNSIKTLSFATVLASAALLAGGASAATIISTLPAWNGTDAVANWGIPDTRVYGQSITAPVGVSTLTGFSFQIRDTVGRIGYAANVYAWNGSSIAGPPLFILAGQSFGGGGTDTFLPVSFSTSVTVTPGNQYMMFLSTIGVQTNAVTVWGRVHDNTYSGGSFRYLNGNNFAALSSSPWDSTNVEVDLAFTATFDGRTVVPVPGALGLMLSGAAALAFIGRRRRKA